MDLGLGNLAELKARLLPLSFTQTTFDAAIAQIGRGVAALMESYCNRLFARVAGAVDYFSADRVAWITQRYPIESVTSVEIRDDFTVGWSNLGNVIVNRQDVSGIVKFGAVIGSHLSEARITYTGGFWYDVSEDSSGVIPGTATLLPADIKESWLLQCAHVWDKRDRLGINLGGTEPDAKSKLGTLEWIPAVKGCLDGNMRYAMTG